MAMISSRNLASTPVLSAVVVLATPPSSAHSVCCGSTSAVAPLSNWLPTQTISAPGVRVSLGPFMAQLWLKWLSTAPHFMWKPPSATKVIFWALVGAVTVPLLPDVVAWGKFRKLLPNLTTRHLTPRIRGKVYKACICSAMLHGSETWGPNKPEPQLLRQNDRAMIHWICDIKDRRNTLSFTTIQTWYRGYYIGPSLSAT